jgi:hypothetical protein
MDHCEDQTRDDGPWKDPSAAVILSPMYRQDFHEYQQDSRDYFFYLFETSEKVFFYYSDGGIFCNLQIFSP